MKLNRHKSAISSLDEASPKKKREKAPKVHRHDVIRDLVDALVVAALDHMMEDDGLFQELTKNLKDENSLSELEKLEDVVTTVNVDVRAIGTQVVEEAIGCIQNIIEMAIEQKNDPYEDGEW